MHGRTIGLLAGVALGLLALACTNETTVLPAPPEPPAITVTGSGSAFGEPDIALLSLGVEAQTASVEEARSRAAEAMDAMLQALKDGGVAEEDIQTTFFSVHPRYDFIGNREVLRGFTVTNLVMVKVRTIDETGELLDAALAAGGDLARVRSLQFTIDDRSALEEEARQEAVAEARRKAETLAQAAGVELGPARSISEVSAPGPRFEFAAPVAFAEEPITPIELGELEVRVEVVIEYGLEAD